MMRMISVVAASACLVAGSAMAAPRQAPTTSRGAGAPASQSSRPAAPAGQTTPAPAAPATPPKAVPFPADAKIAYVNIQEILDQSDLGKAGQAKLKALSDSRTPSITEKNNEAQAKQKEVDAGANVLSASAMNQKQAELASIQRELQFEQQQLQTDMSNLQDSLLDDFQDKVLPIIEKVRVEHNLWLVLTAGGTSNAVLAANPGLDLSMEVVKLLDTATSAAPAAAPAK